MPHFTATLFGAVFFTEFSPMSGFRRLVFCRGAVGTLLAAACILTATQGMAASSTEENYAPVGTAFFEEGQPPLDRLLLLGGSRNGVWYRHADLPVAIQGVTVTPENAMDFENGEDVSCDARIAVPGQSLTLYDQEGKQNEVSIRRTLFFTHPNTGEMFIAAEFTQPVQPGSGLIVGLHGGWDAMPVKTNRTEEAESITFSVGGSDGVRTFSVVLTRARTEEGELFFRNEVVADGKIYETGSVYTGDPQAVSGFFIDLDGDGVMEFVLHAKDIAYSTALAFTADGPRAVMSLDFGN